MVGVLRSLGIWTSKQRGNGPVFPDLTVPEVTADGASTDGTDAEVKEDAKPVTQADEFERAKALKVTMGSAVAKVLDLTLAFTAGHESTARSMIMRPSAGLRIKTIAPVCHYVTIMR